jgi:NAD kinase
VTRNQEIFLTLDGREGVPISERDRVCVKKSKETVLLVQSPDKNYLDVLRSKRNAVWEAENDHARK